VCSLTSGKTSMANWLGKLGGLTRRRSSLYATFSVLERRNVMSSWDYPELPWSSAPNEETRKKQQKKIQAMRKKHLQQLELKDSLSRVVRKYLELHHQDAFLLQSSSQFWKAPSSATNTNDKNAGKEQAKTIEISDTLRTLTELNGFEQVRLPNTSVPLAQGIVVEPHYHKNESYRSRVRQQGKSPILWAQRNLDSVMGIGKPQPRKADKLPELVEEDITLYRILENNVEEFLNAKYQKLNQVVIKAFSFLNRSADNDNQQSSTLPVENNDMNQGKSTESLLFIDRNEIYWVTNMENPELRLLALADHNAYGHKAASTLISFSLVVFGAIPLAYRSYVFTLDYPGSSQMVAASVLVTISYGIWSTKSIAVTRQSQVVSNAIAHRIYARNDAVLWALQQGAVQRVTEGVLALYFHYQQKSQNGNNKTKSIDAEITNLPKISDELLPLAKEIGLIQAKKETGENTWVAISPEDAISRLTHENDKR
jgi:hypothetical protein